MNKEIAARIKTGEWVPCKEERILPCSATEECPYDYDNDPEQDVEGMPVADEEDTRASPFYGHICPEFMEDFDYTPEDLRIRATIHCGWMLEADPEMAKGLSTETQDKIRSHYEELLQKYPEEAYPEYYV